MSIHSGSSNGGDENWVVPEVPHWFRLRVYGSGGSEEEVVEEAEEKNEGPATEESTYIEPLGICERDDVGVNCG